MTDIQHKKTLLRRDLRQRRNALSASQQQTSAKTLAHSVAKLPEWATAQRIALYLSADGEIDTHFLATLARAQGKQIFLPIITDDNHLCFARWDTDAGLSPNRFSIPEPPKEAMRCPAAELDIIFLPLVGWDRHGGRLGMGGGFYDRTLSGVSAPLFIGLAHEIQQVTAIPQEKWDITLDYIATDAALYSCQSG